MLLNGTVWENAFSGNIIDTWNDQTNTLYGGDTYVETDDGGLKPVNALTFVKLGSLAELDATNQLTSATSSGAPADTFAVAFPYADTTQTVLRDNGYKNFQTDIAYAIEPTSLFVEVPAPTGLSATLNIPNVDLSWTGASGATGYKIEHSTDGTTWSTLVADTGNTNTTYTHTAPANNSDNYYQVKTLISSDESSANTATSVLTGANYRTYIDNASSTSCVATGTIYEDGSRGNGVPSQGSGNRYCESTSMEYDVSGIPDSATILQMDIDEIHNVWTAGWNPSCEYKANTSVQPSTGTASQKYSATQTGTVYAYDPLCTTTQSGYNVPLSAQANTDLQSQLSSDWFAISWTMDGFPVLSQTGSGTPSSVNSGSATLNVLHTAPASLAVGGVPEVPTGLTATFNNLTADVDLAWTSPSNSGTIIGYKIEVSTDGTTWSTVTADTGNANTSYSHTTPTLGVLNYYKISAINAYGTGNATNDFKSVVDFTNNPLTSSSTKVSYNTSTNTIDYSLNGAEVNKGARGTIDLETLAGTSLSEDWVLEFDIIDTGVVMDDVSRLSTNIGVSTLDVDNLEHDEVGAFVGLMADIDDQATNRGAYGIVADASGTGHNTTPNPNYITSFESIDSNDTWYVTFTKDGSADTFKAEFYTDSARTGTPLSATVSNVVWDTPRYFGVFDDHDFGGTNVHVGSISQVSFYNGVTTASTPVHPSALAGLPPDPPTITSTSTDSPDTAPLEITVNWQAPTNTGTAGISNYEVYRDSVLITTVGNVATYVDTVPSGGGTFVYELKSVTNHGTSVLSASASHTTPTPPPTPTSAPTLAITNPDSNPLDVTVSFAMPSSGGSAITSFEIFRSADDITYTSVGTTTTLIFADTVPNDGTFYYKFASTNLVGNSGQSPSANIATPTAPDVSSVTLAINDPNASPLVITATPQAGGNGGSAIIDYNLEYSSDNVTWNQVATNLTGGFDQTVSNAGTHYFKTQARNNVGVGALGTAVSIDTPTVPDAPTVTLAINDPNASPLVITSTFVAPLDNGGSSLIDYTLHHSTDDVTYNQVGSNLNGTFDYTVSNSGTHYFKAEVRNNVGLSNLGVSSSIATPTVPTSDSSVTLSIDNPNPNPLDITVSFIAPSNNGGSAVVSYDLHSSPDDITYTQVATGVTADQTITVANAGTWYFKSLTTNNVGSSSLGTAVSIATPTVPTIPTNLVLTSVSNTQIDAVWGAPTTDGGSSLVSYTISLETPSGSGNWNVIATVPASQTTYSFTGLTNDVEYKVGIFSSNNVGNNGNMAMTSEFTRPNAPSNFGVQTVDDDELYIGWDVNGLSTSTFTIQTDYTGSWTDVVTDTYANLCIGNSSGFCEYIVIGLDSGSNYNFRVFNTNTGGVSENSVVVDGWTLNNAPTGLTVTTTANTSTVANLSWTAPSGIVTGYQIERESPAGTGWSVLVTDTGSTATTYDDTGLNLSTYYNYRISAINLGGISTTSNEDSVTTLSVPDAPTGLTLTLQDPLKIQLDWTASGNLYGGNLQGYMIERQINNGAWTTAIANTASTSTTAVDGGLIQGVQYDYRISAITQIGTSLPSVSQTGLFAVGTFSMTVTPIGGNTVEFTPVLDIVSGVPNAVATKIWLYNGDPSYSTPITQIPQSALITSGTPYTFTTFFEYPTTPQTYTARVWVTQDDSTTMFTSPDYPITPLTPFSDNIMGIEQRNLVATATDNAYTASEFEFLAQPAGYDLVLKYQHIDPTNEPKFYAFENVQTSVTSTITGLESNNDYYISAYLNPDEFDYTVVDPATNEVDIVCNSESPSTCPDGTAVDDVPKGVASEFVIRSHKSPTSQTQLGIEPMGDLFGIPMIFLFVIGLGAIFTGRNAQMGILIMAVTIGVMTALGYIDFNNPDTELDENLPIWGIMIVITILGMFVGKRF